MIKLATVTASIQLSQIIKSSDPADLGSALESLADWIQKIVKANTASLEKDPEKISVIVSYNVIP